MKSDSHVKAKRHNSILAMSRLSKQQLAGKLAKKT